MAHLRPFRRGRGGGHRHGCRVHAACSDPVFTAGGGQAGRLALAAGIVVTLASVARAVVARGGGSGGIRVLRGGLAAAGAARWSQSGWSTWCCPRLLAVAVLYRPGVPVAWRGVAVLAVNAAAMLLRTFPFVRDFHGAISGWLRRGHWFAPCARTW
jgi:hypothetical protein